jgi:DNA-binding NarL/FixJ family response regulator
VRILVVDSHSIFRRGIVACLTSLPEVASVVEAESVEDAWARSAPGAVDLVLVDPDLPGGIRFVREVIERTPAQVLVVATATDENAVLAAVQAGAVGYLAKTTLTPEILEDAVRSSRQGGGVLDAELLGRLLRSLSTLSRELLEPRGIELARLSSREQEVLRLVAQGCPTREVARRLSYSERTIKNVIHDITTKLNARSRSQAVAEALRAGLI